MKEKEKKAHSREARGMEKHGFLLEWYAATAQVQNMLRVQMRGKGGSCGVSANDHTAVHIT
jgi:hypothetical protein